jgi:small-conductance mechanosensitive channel
MEIVTDAIRQAWFNVLGLVELYAPRVLAMLLIALLGWVVALVLGIVVREVLRWARFDTLARRLGAEDLLRVGELPPPSRLVGSLVFWLVWVSFLFAGIDALGFQGLESLASEFVRFIPRLVVALGILVIGFLAANFAWRATLLASVNARLPSARLVSAAVRFLIVVLTVAMALEQIAVATTVVLTAFAIAFGAVMIGLAIAFGIGGGGIARRMLEQQFPEREKDEQGGGPSHL